MAGDILDTMTLWLAVELILVITFRGTLEVFSMTAINVVFVPRSSSEYCRDMIISSRSSSPIPVHINNYNKDLIADSEEKIHTNRMRAMYLLLFSNLICLTLLMSGIQKHSEVKVQFTIINLADTSPAMIVLASDTTGTNYIRKTIQIELSNNQTLH